MLKVSHAKPLHDATALMADEARMRNRQSVHMARMRCGARVCCPFTMVVGRERLGATGGASKARMPEMNAQRLCRTQSQQSVHKEARMP